MRWGGEEVDWDIFATRASCLDNKPVYHPFGAYACNFVFYSTSTYHVKGPGGLGHQHQQEHRDFEARQDLGRAANQHFHDASRVFEALSGSEFSPSCALCQSLPVDGEGRGKCVMYDCPGEVQHSRQTATGGVGSQLLRSSKEGIGKLFFGCPQV